MILIEKTMNFAQKMPFFRPKSAIMDIFLKFFSNTNILQMYGQNEIKIK